MLDDEAFTASLKTILADLTGDARIEAMTRLLEKVEAALPSSITPWHKRQLLMFLYAFCMEMGKANEAHKLAELDLGLEMSQAIQTLTELSSTLVNLRKDRYISETDQAEGVETAIENCKNALVSWVKLRKRP